MSLKKFNPNDIIQNTMKTYPQVDIFIYDSKMYYNDVPEQVGKFSYQVRNVSGGFINLYEYNTDRHVTTNPFVYSFITKDSSRISFSTVGATSSINEWTTSSYGEPLMRSLPLSASIVREYMTRPGYRSASAGYCKKVPVPINCAVENRHFFALKNRLNYLAINSPHYLVSSSLRSPDVPANTPSAGINGWDKSNQIINLISIPSIFYGNRIKPGSVSLKWYVTGTLAGELQDKKRNGELIQVSGNFNSPIGLHGQHTGSVAGVVLYEEGFLLLTGSWHLSNTPLALVKDQKYPTQPSWLYWGAGAVDGVNSGSTDAKLADTGGTNYPDALHTGSRFSSASFGLSFQGESETQVLTMFTHAKKGEANYSNNPTYLQYSQSLLQYTSSHVYEENASRLIKNTVSSSFADHSASFRRQVYISRVAIYDDNKNLMGVATLADPVLKEEDQDISFKIKLDI